MDLSRALFLDTETTRHKEMDGLPVEVIELAQTWIGDPAIEVRRFRPRHGMSFGALAVHHILPSDLESHEPSDAAPGRVRQAEFWIGHNIDFDWEALGSPKGVRRICTLAIARHIWPALDSHKLGAAAYFLHGATEATKSTIIGAHNAAVDVNLVVNLLKGMLKLPQMKHLQTLEELYAFSEHARVPLIWTFGKFMGKPIAAADRGYAQWYRKLPDGDPYVLEALRRAGLL